MKSIFIIILILPLLIISCNKKKETKILSEYLTSFGYNLANYKVVCFIPADGCSSCSNPSIEFSKKAGNSFLLVLTSYRSKEINELIESKNLEISKIIIDLNSNAINNGLVSLISPTLYFIENSKIVAKHDLSDSFDKVGVLKLAEEFMKK